jgi:flagellar protein FlgJ
MQIQPATPLALKKIGQTADTTKEAELKKACQGFEAIIVQQLLTAMRKSVPKGGLTEDSYSQDMYQSMYDESLANEMAASKGIGLADTLFRQLSPQGARPTTKQV